MKKELFVEYVAPEVEVVLTQVEAGFNITGAGNVDWNLLGNEDDE